MNHTMGTDPSRRAFLQSTGRAVAAPAVLAALAPRIHAAQDDTIRVALVGCGGRGAGATANALATKQGPIKLVAMARMAVHTGQIVTYEQMLHCEHEFAPDVDKLTMDSPAPVRAGADGLYPTPQPGVLKNREF